MEYNNNNDMVEIIQPTKKAKGKPNTIIDEVIWTHATRAIAWSQQVGEVIQLKRTMI